MATYTIAVVLALMATLVQAQRPSFAGTRSIGFPQIEADTQLLSNRFGEDEPVPIEAKGDRVLINTIEKMPVESRPFWYINAVQYDSLRNKPQTWPLKRNSFVDK
ncbi:uncharacterized protein LOC114360519 [Ostrinia furnacalis]|uniref:uncharacterized protein LOC114360519 n=1 Tax=Ostrinia furnacalis TaxID=93504 RepID=UPI00103BC9F3|nr:uncharacterized protein LOC114360519 [Ostrinia furnacalis]